MSIKTFILALLFMLTLDASERIVSLSPSITEIIFALEKADALVGTSAYSLYPKAAQDIPIVGGNANFNLEKILSLSPTLVVGQSYNQNLLEKLKKFKIKTLILNLKSITSIKESIALLGKTLQSTEASKLIHEIDFAIKQTTNKQNKHSVMIVYGLREDLRSNTYIAGRNVFFQEIIQICGHSNAYTENSHAQPVLNYENIIAINPEQIIILHSLATESNVNVEKALQNWYDIPTTASANGKISIVNESYLHIPSHRIALTIQRLCKEMLF